MFPSKEIQGISEPFLTNSGTGSISSKKNNFFFPIIALWNSVWCCMQMISHYISSQEEKGFIYFLWAELGQESPIQMHAHVFAGLPADFIITNCLSLMRKQIGLQWKVVVYKLASINSSSRSMNFIQRTLWAGFYATAPPHTEKNSPASGSPSEPCLRQNSASEGVPRSYCHPHLPS